MVCIQSKWCKCVKVIEFCKYSLIGQIHNKGHMDVGMATRGLPASSPHSELLSQDWFKESLVSLIHAQLLQDPDSLRCLTCSQFVLYQKWVKVSVLQLISISALTAEVKRQTKSPAWPEETSYHRAFYSKYTRLSKNVGV